ncbi:MAG: hypothetical protein WC475_02725 [Candidatus Paceibacterota bacterium]
MFYFIIWFLASLGAAYLLFKKVGLFAKGLGIAITFLAASAAMVLHNLVSAWLDFKEPVFYIIAFWSFGIGFFLFSAWAAKLISDKFFSNKGRGN